ncbi:hypothetical protein EVAR_74023_1, partial [Eumeta japonica]
MQIQYGVGRARTNRMRLARPAAAGAGGSYAHRRRSSNAIPNAADAVGAYTTRSMTNLHNYKFNNLATFIYTFECHPTE